MSSAHWLSYVKSCYDLVMEAQSKTRNTLPHEVEAYVVHLMAKNFESMQLQSSPVCLQILEALQNPDILHKASQMQEMKLVAVGEQCLLIQGLHFFQSKWPSHDYFSKMGTIAYGLAGHMMEHYFAQATDIFHVIFRSNQMHSGESLPSLMASTTSESASLADVLLLPGDKFH